MRAQDLPRRPQSFLQSRVLWLALQSPPQTGGRAAGPEHLGEPAWIKDTYTVTDTGWSLGGKLRQSGQMDRTLAVNREGWWPAVSLRMPRQHNSILQVATAQG